MGSGLGLGPVPLMPTASIKIWCALALVLLGGCSVAPPHPAETTTAIIIRIE